MLVTHGYTSSRAAIANSARTKKSRFSDALPHGERRAKKIIYTVEAKFQFALPHGERLFFNGILSVNIPFQFALPHGERRRRVVLP